MPRQRATEHVSYDHCIQPMRYAQTWLRHAEKQLPASASRMTRAALFDALAVVDVTLENLEEDQRKNTLSPVEKAKLQRNLEVMADALSTGVES